MPATSLDPRLRGNDSHARISVMPAKAGIQKTDP